ncbi:MAG: hypothetical protein KGD65_05220 [Candidatus Lokiarchaeota archaeon]|nr:hypothetical protein [Candidatus Lokiarchaeota archaeon]
MREKDKHIESKIEKYEKGIENKEERSLSKSTNLNEISKKEDVELGIPSIPEPPKKEDRLSINSPDLAPDVLARIKKVESPDIKVVLVNCERCNAVIPIPIPKQLVLESELPIVPISFVHKNLESEDKHCITIHLDHDFDIRRQRLSDVVISSG